MSQSKLNEERNQKLKLDYEELKMLYNAKI